MSVTASTMLALGSSAPDFELPDTSGKPVRLSDFNDSSVLVVMFICNHCPFVKHVRTRLVSLAKAYQEKGVAFVAISANDARTHPEDAPDRMAEIAREWELPFPYLYDESQAVARAYRAACTPDFFVFDQHRELAYRGRFDDSTPGNDRPVTGEDLATALDRVLRNEPVPEPQQPSMGCNIKWQAGNEPDYA